MKERPIPVWIITIYFTIASLWGAWMYLCVLLGIPGLPPEVATEFAKYGLVELVLLVLQQVLTLAICISLFSLKKLAVPLIAALAVYLLFSTGWFALQADLTERLGTIVFVVVNLGAVAMWGAIGWYAHRLGKRGILA